MRRKPADVMSRDGSMQQQPQAARPEAAPKTESAAPKPAEPPRPVAAAKPFPVSTSNPRKNRSNHGIGHQQSAQEITGELESTEDIQIDGQIEGDVRGVGVKIGQNAKVKGTVYGDEVELAGTIEGKIESKKVILASTARMTGDIWHQEIKIESGAYINGNLKPELGKTGFQARIQTDGRHDAQPFTGGRGKRDRGTTDRPSSRPREVVSIIAKCPWTGFPVQGIIRLKECPQMSVMLEGVIDKPNFQANRQARPVGCK